jgi:hypothetical protein
MDDDSKLDILAEFSSTLEADLLAGRLRDAGIECTVTGRPTADYAAMAPGVVRVLVKGDDLNRARPILDAFRAESKPESEQSGGE